ncbi:KinB-signaling pathway activation protein [Paenisporosarcina sp. TG20]|uniref:KinB-signaling pathway activation protein n=1 Tax=Paenisporosarcina sp. TG20 TaxID=1211706 RepID=UPI00031DF3FA|nr:KinB-signaling pathway activation protein [Paenisporosarcina sp. TG20]
MTIRNWFIFFIKALVIGGVVTGIAGLFIRWEDAFAPYVATGEYGEFAGSLLWFMFLGMTMSVISQMGFFAYLTIHQFGVNIFKSLTLWNWVQLLIIAVVIFDLIRFRFMPLANTQGQLLLYLGLLAVLLISGLVVAYFKAKWTKKHAFISALFFMIVITTLEWLPVLMVNEKDVDRYVALLLFPLLAVNAYQLLKLPKYNAKSEVDRLKLVERRRLRALKTKEKL